MYSIGGKGRAPYVRAMVRADGKAGSPNAGAPCLALHGYETNSRMTETTMAGSVR